jgi:hypothetical protein
MVAITVEISDPNATKLLTTERGEIIHKTYRWKALRPFEGGQKMTNQELFNKVVCAVRNQGRPSKSLGGFCRYRGESGAKCAVGFLIPDDKYDPEMERYLAIELQKKFPDAVEYTAEQARLVRALQDAHDRASVSTIRRPSAFVDEFNRVVEFVAIAFDLKTP